MRALEFRHILHIRYGYHQLLQAHKSWQTRLYPKLNIIHAEPQSDTKQADDAKQPEAKDRTKEGYARPDKKDLGTADNLDEAPTEGEAHTKAQSYIHKRS